MDNRENRFGTARDVNPDAGTHAVATHPDERMAAEAATRQSWREFPYYARRYGERGWRFSLSDSGWLATLSEASDSAAVAQTEWLARLLAARGMPRYLLERHLLQLHAELAKRLGTTSRYNVLLQCAASLTSGRVARISGDDFRRMARDFEMRVHAIENRVVNMGVVLVAAVADDAGGVPAVADSVYAWAADPARFALPWIDAVNATLAEAREVASTKLPARG